MSGDKMWRDATGVSRRANYLGVCGVRGVAPAHVLSEAGSALLSRAVFRVLLDR